MCIDFDGHHFDGSSFVYVNDFCYYRNCLYTIGTSSALKKKKKKKVKSPSIWFRTPKLVRIRQSGRDIGTTPSSPQPRSLPRRCEARPSPQRITLHHCEVCLRRSEGVLRCGEVARIPGLYKYP